MGSCSESECGSEESIDVDVEEAHVLDEYADVDDWSVTSSAWESGAEDGDDEGADKATDVEAVSQDDEEGMEEQLLIKKYMGKAQLKKRLKEVAGSLLSDEEAGKYQATYDNVIEEVSQLAMDRLAQLTGNTCRDEAERVRGGGGQHGSLKERRLERNIIGIARSEFCQIPKSRFKRCVIAALAHWSAEMKMATRYRIRESAVEALQVAAEDFLTELFRDAWRVTRTCDKRTLMAKHMDCAADLTGKGDMMAQGPDERNRERRQAERDAFNRQKY